MEERHEEALLRMGPNIYTNLPFGFECGNGWYRILAELSVILEDLVLREPAASWSSFYATQVKEKYGTLRFYMSCETDAMGAAIDLAERQSEETCELCGEPGRLYNRGWCMVRCQSCLEDKEDA